MDILVDKKRVKLSLYARSFISVHFVDLSLFPFCPTERETKQKRIKANCRSDYLALYYFFAQMCKMCIFIWVNNTNTHWTSVRAIAIQYVSNKFNVNIGFWTVYRVHGYAYPSLSLSLSFFPPSSSLPFFCSFLCYLPTLLLACATFNSQ